MAEYEFPRPKGAVGKMTVVNEIGRHCRIVEDAGGQRFRVWAVPVAEKKKKAKTAKAEPIVDADEVGI